MNSYITLLLNSENKTNLIALKSLLVSGNRPCFRDEVQTEWQSVYDVIELIDSPENIKQVGNYLLLEWSDSHHELVTLINQFNKISLTAKFTYSMEGDPAAADEGAGDDDLDGCFRLYTDRQIEVITRNNYKLLLSGNDFLWSDEIDSNIQNIVAYLTAH